MKSKNPILARTQDQASLAEYGHQSADGRPVMTLDSVVTRTATLFAVLLPVAAAAFVFKVGAALVLIAALIAFVIAIFVIRSATPRPPLMFAYAALEGLAIGGISGFYANQFGGNVVPQAVLGTLCAFAVMLGMYRAGWVRATPKFRRTLLIASVGYLVFGLAHFLGVMFGAWDSIYFGQDGPNLFGIAASALGVVFSSLFLVLDFDEIERGIDARLPEQHAWVASFSLLVTLVWMYLEILRFTSILGDD